MGGMMGRSIGMMMGSQIGGMVNKQKQASVSGSASTNQEYLDKFAEYAEVVTIIMWPA